MTIARRTWPAPALVGTAFTLMNLNDIMDQSVRFSGVAFNNALFWYGKADETPINLIEIVDNITFQASALVVS